MNIIQIRDIFHPSATKWERQDIVASICEAVGQFDPTSPDIWCRPAKTELCGITSIKWHIFYFPFGGRRFTINVDLCDLTKFEVEDITRLKLVVVMKMTVSIGELLSNFCFITAHQLAAIYHDAALRMDGVTKEE